jgi:hypothetical protein
VSPALNDVERIAEYLRTASREKLHASDALSMILLVFPAVRGITLVEAVSVVAEEIDETLALDLIALSTTVEQQPRE